MEIKGNTQMFKTLTAAALIASTTMVAAPAQASGGCYASWASQTMETAMAGGASLNTAWKWAIDDGAVRDTQRCWTMVVGNVRQYHLIYPNLVRAIF